MLVLLTPSKTMDFTSAVPSFAVPTTPVFADEATQVRSLLATYDAAAIQSLMSVSERLARSVQGMYHQTAAKQAFWTYAGDVFRGVQAHTIDEATARYAQRHVLIPSAVYGLVRPFDAIAPYRLEMSAKLSIEGSKSLYDFWGDRLAKYVASYRQDELLVLSSKEYSRAILRHLPSDIIVVTPMFLDTKADGRVAQVPIYNKMMRGVMARWVIDERVESTDDLVNFSAHDYIYDAARSTPHAPVFYRRVMAPLVF